MDPQRRVGARAKRLMARQLRRDATPVERQAWAVLRGRRILGLKFRRQHVLDGLIVDFYCAELRLVIELDGRHHEAASPKRNDGTHQRSLPILTMHA